MAKSDAQAVAAIVAATAFFVIYRQIFIEPRGWGEICAAAPYSLPCAPRWPLFWMQRHYLLGTLSLGLGLWSFLWRGPFIVSVVAIIAGIGGVEYYNATWGAVGAALGVWTWLRRKP